MRQLLFAIGAAVVLSPSACNKPWPRRGLTVSNRIGPT